MDKFRQSVFDYVLKQIDDSINTLIIKCADDPEAMEKLHTVLTIHTDSISHLLTEETYNNE